MQGSDSSASAVLTCLQSRECRRWPPAGPGAAGRTGHALPLSGRRLLTSGPCVSHESSPVRDELHRACHGLLEIKNGGDACHRRRGEADLLHDPCLRLRPLHLDACSGRPAVAPLWQSLECSLHLQLAADARVETTKLRHTMNFKRCVQPRGSRAESMSAASAVRLDARESVLIQPAVASCESVGRKLALAVKESDSEAA